MALPAEALQQPTPPVETDAVVIGAGPVGLFQVFQLGLLEMKAHVIDSLPQPGGQCVELYADKPIYDIPAVPVCTGRELTASLLQQIAPFGASLHLGQEVTTLQRQPDGRFLLDTSRGTRLLARVVMIAAGVGSFQPRTLKVDGIERFAARPDAQLLYHVADPAQLAGRHIVIVGGGDSALEAALQLAEGDDAQRAASVVLVHRRDVFQAAAATDARFRAACAAGRLQLVVGQVSGFTEDQGRLQQVQVTGPDGASRLLPLDTLLVLQGLSPRLGPVAGWGLAIERKQLVVDTARFETSEPGIFAVGDINTYPGKRKLIVCGFHEATLAAYAAAALVFPGRPVLLQYTTTSPRLHALLGVESPPLD